MMSKFHVWQAACLCLLLFSVTACPTGYGGGDDTAANGWKLPPTGTVTRGYPHLVNYYHFSPNETPADQRSERLAQWDIVIIFPYKAAAEGLDFARMRQLNPGIKILAWIPLGQAPDTSRPFGAGIPTAAANPNWFLKDTTGGYVTLGAPYYEHIMNPYKAGQAWPKYIVDFVEANYLDNDLYDGVFLDCMWNSPPTWLYTGSTANVDVDEDGDFDFDDYNRWFTGVTAALSGVRARCPGKLVTGNNGVPLSAGSPYWPLIDGSYHENALGDEFGDPNWTGSSGAVWDGYQTAMSAGATRHMIGVDTRAGDSVSFDAASVKNRLTADDLRRMRLGLGTSLLLDGGYFGFDSGDCIHGQLWWFDEYDADLGQPAGGFTVTGSGLYTRAFTKGAVYVNPTDHPVIINAWAMFEDATSKQVNDRFIVPSLDSRILSSATGREASNLLVNGTFDYGTTGWGLWANNGSAGSIIVENGRLRATVTSPGTDIWDIGITQENVPLENGVTYTATFRAMADRPCRLINLVQLNHAPWTIYSGNDLFAIDTMMKSYSFTFTMHEPTDNSSFYVFHIGGNGANVIQLDDIRFRKAD
jgi:hypothetical protein